MKNMFNSKFKEDSGQSLGLSFIKAYNTWHKGIKNALIDIDITHPQFVVMASVGYLHQFSEEITQVMISEQSNIDTRTLSQILKLLVQKKIIQRETSKLDSRAKKITLTALGEKKLEQAITIVEKIDCNFFGILNESEQIQFANCLKKIEGFESPLV